MILAYLAHPVSGDVPANLAKARVLLTHLQAQHPGHAFIAPWITWLECGDDDTDPAMRGLGLLRDVEVLTRCDELWLVGPCVSPGMQQELEAAEAAGLRIYNLTGEDA